MAFDSLPLRPPVEPMETRQVARIPEGEEWIYEPKWDGFRCLAFRDGNDVELQSKSGESLTRYFPEIVTALKNAATQRFRYGRRTDRYGRRHVGFRCAAAAHPSRGEPRPQARVRNAGLIRAL